MADLAGLPPVRTLGAVDSQGFTTEVLAHGQPVLLKGQVAGWPAVQADVAVYLKGLDAGVPTPVAILPEAAGDLYFYNTDLTGLNYRTAQQLLPRLIDMIVARAARGTGDRLYLQSLPISTYLPRFETENPMPLLGQTIGPRIWIGGPLTLQTHFDLKSNLACCVAGRRQFILFPSDQIANLYPGPDDFTPGGAPVSMAPLDPLDLDRFPKLAAALEHAVVADLEPGDALYIPYGWWHRVRSLAGFNVLVNYWWDQGTAPMLPAAALKAALLSVKALPPAERDVWKALFDYYVFETSGDSVAHLPLNLQGSYGAISPQRLAALVEDIRAALPRAK